MTHSAHHDLNAPGRDAYYARLFRDTFADRSNDPTTIAGYPFYPPAHSSSDPREAMSEEEAEAERQRVAAAARAWLKEALTDVSTGKKWDPTTVTKISSKLTFSFDDFMED